MANNQWKFFNDLWSTAETKKDFVQKCYNYWNGKSDNPGLHGQNAQKNTENIIRQVVECKTVLALDNMITLQVVPQLGSFESIKSMGDMQKIADIRNDNLQEIMKINSFDKFKERAMRWGEICGFSPAEVVFDKDNKKYGHDGEVALNVLDPRCVKWDKSAKNIRDVAYFGVEIEPSAQSAKKAYAINPDGSENIELMNVIDKAAGIKKDNKRGSKAGVVSYKDDSGNGGQAYAEQKDATESSIKTIKLVRMYLKDDSMYLHTDGDSNKEAIEKQEWRAKYPSGRLIVFIPNEQFQTILKDEALPKSFSDCFGIANFNPLELDTIDGHGEVEPLMFIQERINAAYQRLWWLVAAFVSTIMVQNGTIELEQGDLVNSALTKVEGNLASAVLPLTNNTLSELTTVLALIETLEAKALRIARINEELLSGVRQDGVTSEAQQVGLKESPMAGIRQIQRNFKDFLVDIGNKCMTLMDEYYDMHRLIKLSTKMDNATYAAFTAEGNQKAVLLYNDAGMVVKKIVQNPDWKFQVEVTAGTEVIRSRHETAAIIDKLYAEGKLGNPDDLDIKELYFNAIDLPNRRAIIQLLRQKLEEAKPPRAAYDDTEYMKAFASEFKELDGFTQARRALLRANDLPDSPDGLADAPIQSITNRGDTMEVATVRAQLGEATPKQPQPTKDELEQYKEEKQNAVRK